MRLNPGIASDVAQPEPRPARELADMLRELLAYRELMLSVARRDLLVRYKETAIGVAWAVFTPVLQLLVFSVVFTRVVPVQTEVPYPVYAYTGLLPWSFFAAAVHFGSGSLTGNAALLTKVYFPRAILPFAAVLVSLADLLVASSVLGLLLAYYEIPLSWAILLLPLILLVQVAFTLGVVLLTALAQLHFRDVKYLLGTLLTAWMFATSVVYPIERVDGLAGAVLGLNPMTPIIGAYRAVLLDGRAPGEGSFLVAAAVSVGLLLASCLLFHRAERRFAEIV